MWLSYIHVQSVRIPIIFLDNNTFQKSVSPKCCLFLDMVKLDVYSSNLNIWCTGQIQLHNYSLKKFRSNWKMSHIVCIKSSFSKAN